MKFSFKKNDLTSAIYIIFLNFIEHKKKKTFFFSTLQTSTAAQVTHNRFPSLDSSGVEDNLSLRPTMTSGVGVVETIGVDPERFSGEQFGSISSLASSTSLITQQELAQLLEEATLEEPRGERLGRDGYTGGEGKYRKFGSASKILLD